MFAWWKYAEFFFWMGPCWYPWMGPWQCTWSYNLKLLLSLWLSIFFDYYTFLPQNVLLTFRIDIVDQYTNVRKAIFPVTNQKILQLVPHCPSLSGVVIHNNKQTFVKLNMHTLNMQIMLKMIKRIRLYLV